MKNGLFYENDELIYYKDDEPYHAGIVEDNGDFYYISRHGRAVRGIHVVHRDMAHGLVPHGTYDFGDDYKLIEGSYLAPKKQKSSKNKKRSSGKKKKHLSKSNKFNIAILCSVSVAMAVLCIVAGILGSLQHENNEHNNTEQLSDISVILPTFDEEVLLCTPDAKAFFDGECSIEDAIKGGSPYRPLVFNYSIKGGDGVLSISERADLSNPRTFVLSSKSNSLSIDNLKTGTNYYYSVTVQDKEYSGSFKTAESPRFIKIPGVYNTRDIGGYTNLDGNKIKQGYIIRGGELDGLVVINYFLTKENAEIVTRDFGFVFDLDLRESTLVQNKYNSRLGADVRHRFYTAPAYGQLFNVSFAESVKEIFADLADPNNYPMYLHCTYGADRTGTIIYLLQGILNMSEDDMLNEYLLTALRTEEYATYGYMDVVVSNIKQHPGDTICEQTEDFLINTIGVTKQQIESIRNILIDKD